jgi:peptidyl-dipeptidase A
MIRPPQLPYVVFCLLSGALTLSCRGGTGSNEGAPAAAGPSPAAERARTFLADYEPRFAALYKASSEAEWASNTHIVAGDETNSQRTRAANEALAAFAGSVENIEAARSLLKQRDGLEPLQVKSLERVLFLAAGSPQTVPELVKERIAAEAAQTEVLYGYTYRLDGAEVTTNDLDRALREEKDVAARPGRRPRRSARACAPA